MQELLPLPASVADVLAALSSDDRPAPGDRPWVMANMVVSIDGAFAVDGRSGALGTPGDREVFHALRTLADVILVGAGTARDERYRRPAPAPETRRVRAERGQTPAPRLVLVSRSGVIPPDQPFLSGDGPDPLLVHDQPLDPDAVPCGLEALELPDRRGGVDLPGLLGRLRSDGTDLLLCEGGPGLLGQMHRADLIDELFVTISPNLVGGKSVGLLGSGPADLRPRRLHRLWRDGADALFATYRRA